MQRNLKKIWVWFPRLVMVVFALATVCAIYQAIATARDIRRYPPPGKLVDVGDHRLHLYCTGEGRPTVILDAGSGSASLSWSLVQPGITKFTRVCSYDRAGFGWSDPGPTPRNLHRVIHELHALLINAGIQEPYILVGHSLGGLFTKMYARQYPSEVAGMVWVDATPEPEDSSRLADIQKAMAPHVRKVMWLRIAARLGWERLTWMLETDQNLMKLPSQVQAILKAEFSSAKFYDALYHELNENLRGFTDFHPGPLPEVPTVVMVHGDPDKSQPPSLSADEKKKALEKWQQYNKTLAGRLRKSSFIVAERSGHLIPYDQPELVINAIHQVVETNRD